MTETNWIDRLRQSEEGRRLLEQERLIVEATEAIASLLEERKMTRAELARRIRKTPAHVTKLLGGSNNFTLRTLCDIFFTLDRSVHIRLGCVGEDLIVCDTETPIPLSIDSSGWQQVRGSWAMPQAPICTRGNGSKGLAA